MWSAIDRRMMLSFTSSSRAPSSFGGARCRSSRLDLRDHRADPDDLALAGVDLDQRALEGGGDLGVDLVGHDLDDRLVALDELPLALQPLLDGSLGDRLAELRHLDLSDTHAESSLAASPTVAAHREGVGGDAQNRTGDGGFADLCLTTWLRRPDLDPRF